MVTLGIKPYGHDTSAAIVVDGKIIAATSEERFNREKHSRKFPSNAINFCLKMAGVKNINDVDEISVGFDYLKLAFYLDFVGFFKYFPHYIKESIENGTYQINKVINTRKILRKHFGYKGKIRFLDHHDCHAASCYYPSNFNKAAILTVDGRGERASTRIYQAKNNQFNTVFQLNYPNSLGAFYSCITEYLGFRDNCDEGKTMGLAAYGGDSLVKKMRKILFIGGGSYKLNLDYFDFHRFPERNISKKFIELFGQPRKNDEKINQRHKDIAKAAQVLLEEAIIEIAKRARRLTGEKTSALPVALL